MASLQHLQAVTLVDVQQCHVDTLAAALPRLPLDRLTLDRCSVLFEGQQADERAEWLQWAVAAWQARPLAQAARDVANALTWLMGRLSALSLPVI